MPTPPDPIERMIRSAVACAALLAAGLLTAVTDPRPHVAGAAVDTVVLSVYPNGKGSVTVESPAPLSSSPPADASSSICPGTGDQGAACRFTFPRGTIVTLSAQPDPGTDSALRGWSEVLCPGIGRCSTQLTDDEEYVAALFSPQAVKIDVAGGGTVTANGRPCTVESGFEGNATLDCGTFAIFETVKLVAVGDRPVWNPLAADGTTRSVPCDETSPAAAATPGTASCTIIADRFRWLRLGFAGLVANGFLPQPSDTRLKVRTRGSGTVTNASKTISCPGRCSIPGSGGSEERLIAQGSPGWRFVRWGLCRSEGAANVCVARLGVTVRADFERVASAPKSSTASLVGPSGRGSKRRVRFTVDLGAPGTVRASLIRNRRNYGKPLSVSLGAVRRTLSLRVKKGAPRGGYRLKVTITGAAPLKDRFGITLGR